MKKRIIIIVSVVLFLFLVLLLLPDSFFKKHSKYGWLYESDMFNNGDDSNKIGWTISLEEMMDDLLKGKYNYDYSLENRSYKYICSGRKDGEEDNGECTSPEEVSYNKDTFKNVFDKLNIRYLDFSYIYNLIKDEEGTYYQYENSRMYYYNVISNNADTEIYVYTDQVSITEIMIINDYLTYDIKYSNVEG